MGNISGYNASLSVGTYSGANLKNVTVTMNGETIDVSDLTSRFRQTAIGLAGWEVTGTKGVTTAVFIDLMEAAASGATSVAVAVWRAGLSPTTVFAGVGWITNASLTFPMGAAEETITITGNGGPTNT